MTYLVQRIGRTLSHGGGDIRIWQSASAALWLVMCAAACGDDTARPSAERQVRTQRLQPRDLEKVRQQAEAARRVTDTEGALLPSNNYVAGVQLPRGLTAVRAQRRTTAEGGGGDFYFNTRSSQAALRAYFGPRLLTGKIKTGGRGTVTYVHASPKGDKEGHVVSVRIGPSPSDPRRNQIYISEVPKNPMAFPSEAQVKAEMEARRKYAD